MKFVPLAHRDKFVFDSDSWRYTDYRACDCPNVIFFIRSDCLDIENYLSEPWVNWGNHGSLGGGRSVMLAAFKILYYLGVRQVYLLGVDFDMGPDAFYHFTQGRSRAAIRGNRKLFQQLIMHFEKLKPVFQRAGFNVFNCNPDSKLEVFPFLSMDEAIERCRKNLPAEGKQETTAGLYDRDKPDPKQNPLQSRRGNASRVVVVGVDRHHEWMLHWWWERYRAHNDMQVNFLNFGMTDSARKWCLSHGDVLQMDSSLPRFRKAWFYKPSAFVVGQGDYILFLDVDCEIRGDVESIFEYVGDSPMLAKDRHIFGRYRGRFDPDRHYNTGVIVARRHDPLMLAWGRATVQHHAQFRSDQEIFNDVLQSGDYEIEELPQKFNRLRLDGDDPEAVIMHWTGEEGKAEIRRQIGASGC